jgi:hypothetical protein
MVDLRSFGPKAVAAAFSPTDIAGLKLWIDFSDITTLYTDSAKTTPVTADGDVIGAAEDKSGNGNDGTQATTAKKFTYKTGIKNSLSAALVGADSDNMITPLTQAQPFTIYAVIYPTTANNNANYVHSTSPLSICRVASVSTIMLYCGAVLTLSVSDPRNLWHVLTSIPNGASSSVRQNAGTPATGNAGASGMTNISLSYNSANAFVGYWSEILIYNSIISGADDTNVLTYLNAKWTVY